MGIFNRPPKTRPDQVQRLRDLRTDMLSAAACAADDVDDLESDFQKAKALYDAAHRNSTKAEATESYYSGPLR